MLYSILIYIASILMTIFSYLSVAGKIKVCRSWTGYLCLILIPFYIVFFPVMLLDAATSKNAAHFIIIPVFVIGVGIFVLFGYIAVQLNFFPKKFLKEGNEDNKTISIKASRLLLYHSLFAVIYYTIPVVVLIASGVYLAVFAVGMFILPTLLVLLSPIMAFSSGVLFCMAGVICVVVCAFSVNAVLRASYLVKGVRKHIIRHVVFMFIPLFNIISLVQISLEIRKELSA